MISKVFILPTETYYALGCLSSSDASIQKIYVLKKRDKKLPLLVLISNWKMLEEYFIVSSAIQSLLQQYWPGPLTVILQHKNKLSPFLNQSSDTLAVRFTSHLLAQKLIEQHGVPIVGTSANISGQKEVQTIEEAKKIFGDSVEYIDGGRTAGGLPTTILDLSIENQVKVLRQGGLKIDV